MRIGERAPDFALPNQRSETVRLPDRLSKGPVVLNFYRNNAADAVHRATEMHHLTRRTDMNVSRDSSRIRSPVSRQVPARRWSYRLPRFLNGAFTMARTTDSSSVPSVAAEKISLYRLPSNA